MLLVLIVQTSSQKQWKGLQFRLSWQRLFNSGIMRLHVDSAVQLEMRAS
jgi:hypothetical protein